MNNFDIYTFNSLVEEARERAISIGYPEVANHKYLLVMNSRAKSRFGQCKKLDKEHFEIQLNSDHAKYNSKEAVFNTVFHEVLHSIDGGMTHKGEWKKASEKANAKYADINLGRCATSEMVSKEYRASVTSHAYGTRKPRKSYVITCEFCGTMTIYHRKTQLVLDLMDGRTDVCYCNRCKGEHFTVEEN